MDTFVEQIVKKKKSGKDKVLIFGSIFLYAVLLIVGFPIAFIYLQFFAVIIFGGLGYGLWWLLTSQNVEYEYSVTNGDIDIDQITAQRKRKRLVSVAGSKIESLQPYRHEEFASRPFGRRVIVAPSLNEPELWCFTYHSKKSGHTLVVFQPEQRVLNALKAGLSALVLRETNKKFQ